MDMPTAGPHQIVNPPSMAAAVGFSHAVAAGAGRTVYLGGQGPLGPDGTVVGTTIVEQFDQTAANVVEALAGAGGRPEHIVWMQIFVTEIAAYRAAMKEIGVIYRKHFGRFYPGMALIEVSSLMEPGAQIEIMGIAVVPEQGREHAPYVDQ